MCKRFYCWVVLGCFTAVFAGCTTQESDEMTSWSDIGSPDDMTAKQADPANRGIPKATEMPPGLGEDLPMPPQAPATPPVTKNN